MHKLSQIYSRQRNSALLLTLLLTLIIAPVAGEFRLPAAPIELLLLIAAAFAASGNASSRMSWALWLLALLAALFRIVGYAFDLHAASRAGVLIWILLALAASVATLHYALRGRQVDLEHIAAALSAYLLAGHLFGVTFHELNRYLPVSFSLAGQPVAQGALDLQSAIYFSFVTLTTLGYGDLAPVSPTARGLAVSEAIAGQFYLAVLVSRLVSAFRQDPNHK
jgi:hypothetical protein